MRSGKISPETRATLRKMRDEKSVKAKGAVPTRLYTHNVDVDTENDKELNKLSGVEQRLRNVVKRKSSHRGSAQERHTGARDSAPKEKAAVMFIKNSFDEGYVNGTLGVVEDFDNSGTPIVRTFSGRKIFVTPAEWTVEEEGKSSGESGAIAVAFGVGYHGAQKPGDEFGCGGN